MISPSIAVLIPCHNEQAAIARVVTEFRAALPTATIYVYDNNSQDDTVELAKRAGARVYREPMQGKGNVVRRRFTRLHEATLVRLVADFTAPQPPVWLYVRK